MDFERLKEAAVDQTAVNGHTHSFYRYPARFSPQFARTVISLFTKPGEVVLDPYMGGGTTVVEALAAGRRVFGNDINTLSHFVTDVKTTLLSESDTTEVKEWFKEVAGQIHYRHENEPLRPFLDDTRTRNLHLPKARAIKKSIAIVLQRLSELTSHRSQNFARCVLLRTSQWALDNRKKHTTVEEFKDRLNLHFEEMLDAIVRYRDIVHTNGSSNTNATLLNADAALLHESKLLSGTKVDLVLTSPPYPGVHVLYHRWQVDGRRESPAPYWIANCQDGHGCSFYTFGDRRLGNSERYFETMSSTMRSIRQTLRKDGHVVQMVAFSDPRPQLRKFLSVMRNTGFEELMSPQGRRIYRQVPGRKWHANLKGNTSSSREVVLIHKAA